MATHTDPAHLTDAVDPFETLRVGHPVVRSGILERARGGFLVVSMAERLPDALALALAQAADRGDCGLILLDESLVDEQPLSAALRDRMGCCLDMRDETWLRDGWGADPLPMQGALASDWMAVLVPEDILHAVMEACVMLGIVSARPCLACLRMMRLHAWSEQRTQASAEDLAWAATWCLLPHARQLPMPSQEQASSEDEDPQDEAPQDEPAQDEPGQDEPAQDEPTPSDMEPSLSEPQTDQQAKSVDEQAVETAAAALPKGLLDAWAKWFVEQGQGAGGGGGQGRLGESGRGRGRPVGVIRRKPRGGTDLLAILPTLRAAIPFQTIRVRSQSAIALRPDDLHVWRLKRQRGITTVFVVDASGSSAMARLAEAKGAIEILLSECYSRRDRVALIAFGGRGAELRLPPTRSLVAARRSLSALVGGGGSPIAAGFAMAAEQLIRLRLQGDDTCLVVLSDGRANIARDGTPGRPRAMEEAVAMARRLSTLTSHRLLIDTSARPEPAAARLSDAMAARYLPLPMARARGIHEAIQAVRRLPTAT